jgi:hypothetical protein
MASAFNGIATLTATLQAAAIELEAAVTGTGTLTAALTTAITPAAALSGTGSLAAALSTAITPAAILAGTGTIAAALTTSITMASTLSGTGTIFADLTGGAAVVGYIKGKVMRYTYNHTDRRYPSIKIPQYIVCDFETDLPTIDIREGDLAYAKDTNALWKYTETGWVAV